MHRKLSSHPTLHLILHFANSKLAKCSIKFYYNQVKQHLNFIQNEILI